MITLATWQRNLAWARLIVRAQRTAVRFEHLDTAAMGIQHWLYWRAATSVVRAYFSSPANKLPDTATRGMRFRMAKWEHLLEQSVPPLMPRIKGAA